MGEMNMERFECFGWMNTERFGVRSRRIFAALRPPRGRRISAEPQSRLVLAGARPAAVSKRT